MDKGPNDEDNGNQKQVKGEVRVSADLEVLVVLKPKVKLQGDLGRHLVPIWREVCDNCIMFHSRDEEICASLELHRETCVSVHTPKCRK